MKLKIFDSCQRANLLDVTSKTSTQNEIKSEMF